MFDPNEATAPTETDGERLCRKAIEKAREETIARWVKPAVRDAIMLSLEQGIPVRIILGKLVLAIQEEVAFAQELIR